MALIKKGLQASKQQPRTATSRFVYRARSPEQVRERAQRAVGGRDSYFDSDVQFFTPRVGDNNVRIMPPPPNKDWGHYGVNIAVHYGIGADQNAYLCANKMKDEACPLCEERDRATAAGEEDLADALRPSFRVAVYVIDRAQEGKGPLLWNIAAGLDKDIVKLCIDPSSGEVLPVDDPADGYDLNFNREGEGLKTKYKGIQFSRRSSPLADDQDVGDKWLQYVVDHPIDECLVYHEYDHIVKVFAGQAPPDGGEIPPATKPQADAPSVKPRTATKPATETKVKPRVAAPPKQNEAADGGENAPTWDEIAAMDEDDLAGLGEAFQVEFPADGFEDIEQLRDFVAAAVGVEKPKPQAAAEPAKGDWRARLRKMQGK